MQLTPEQQDIINSKGNIKINAVAGSGKTTTVIEYAKSRPKESKILYLAFNKSVKLEAERKFSAQELNNVKVETAHSLAYKHIVFKYDYKVRVNGYKTQEIAELLGLQNNGEKHAEYIVANHISKFISYFCNSDARKVTDLNYLDVVFDPKAKVFVTSFYDYILEQVRLLLNKMDKGEIEITHDFYLKKFQLSNPTLPYDYILFDEAQDASEAMLDVFLNQKATKVMVGDVHQQIYSWRYAINSLERADFKTYNLSTSFRFGSDIADLAMEILKWKNHLVKTAPVLILGQGNSDSSKSRAVVARSNLGLLLKAIEYVSERKNVKSIYFEGNINSYTYADDGASLYDVLSLFNGKREMIKDKLIKGMKDLDELSDYIDKTEDKQLGMMVGIVEEYGNKIPSILKEIKDKHIEDNDKTKAELIFTTVHKSKGMEYDSVELVNDFMSEYNLKRIIDGSKEEELDYVKMNEEINLLYVAVTRSKNIVKLPEGLLPDGVTSSSHIFVYKTTDRSAEAPRVYMKEVKAQVTDTGSKVKAYSVEEVRAKHKDAYSPWTPAQDRELKELFKDGVRLDTIAKHFGRTRGAIGSRIKKLNLDKY